MNHSLNNPLPGTADHPAAQYGRLSGQSFAFRKFLIALLIASAALLAIWLAVYGLFGGLDDIKMSSARLPFTTWQALSLFGDARVLLLFALPFCRRRPELLWAIVVSALLGWLMSRGIKLIIHLPRPNQIHETALLEFEHRYSGRFSFPSGHTVTAFSFAGIWLAALPFRKAFPFTLLAGLVGYSRLMLGVHWPVDIIGGAMVGLLATLFSITLCQRWDWGERRKPHYALVAFCLLAIASQPFIDTGYPALYPWRVMFCVAGTFTSLALYGHQFFQDKTRLETQP